MKKQIEQVIAFQKKNGFDIGLEFDETYNKTFNVSTVVNDIQLVGIARVLKAQSDHLEDTLNNNSSVPCDNRILRAHLMLEELSEVLLAMANKDTLCLLDGLTDLLYVTIGTGTNLPLEEAFDEVQRSNMTKIKKSSDIRLRDKGTSYSPPNLEKVLADSRNGK